MAQIDFPRALLREKAHSWNLVGVAATPGQTAVSFAPIVRSDGGGIWTCSMSDISLSGGNGLRGKDRQKLTTLLWRAVRQIADGGVTPLVVPRNDALFLPWPAGVARAAGIDIPHSDGALFSDGSGYYQSIIDITAAAAALRATSLDITINYAGELMGGESFSIEHETMGWRVYEIATVSMDDGVAGTITFMPPLREAIPANTQLEFDRPRCVMRLAKTSSMDLSVQPWTFNSASVDFVETFA
ncbi:hypothetical protein [Bradyrhizobium sp. 18]|uniref:hypothetical protein n=1 Tax=Bradyrhizobium sp. 18 TaxID=2782657 RepID=UPI001FF7EAA0|nr:hypothetical protein [Bradyrhizobium sp. 18]MCK1503858.1 hypothetical protein [Bradyrhizobium sp. 18]